MHRLQHVRCAVCAKTMREQHAGESSVHHGRTRLCVHAGATEQEVHGPAESGDSHKVSEAACIRDVCGVREGEFALTAQGGGGGTCIC